MVICWVIMLKCIQIKAGSCSAAIMFSGIRTKFMSETVKLAVSLVQWNSAFTLFMFTKKLDFICMY